jgi:hypothetical protein
MVNHWLDLANRPIEKEVILVKNSSETKGWYARMPSALSVIFPDEQPKRPDAFCPKIGIAHHLRYTRFGIEGVLKMPKKFHKLSYYVLHDRINQPYEPFWVVVYK